MLNAILSLTAVIFPSYKIERRHLDRGFDFVIGCDEAGMGPLAGPVVAAACIVPIAAGEPRTEDKWYYRLRDSKTMGEAEREALLSAIETNCEYYAVGESSVAEIEKLNIHHARFLAMQCAVNEVLKRLPAQASVCILVDGKFIIPEAGLSRTVTQQAIVKGDSSALSIAAASVLAKTHRDHLMKKLDAKYPAYGFAKHKGYGTKDHIAAIRWHGPSAAHRKSFLGAII